jgi:hypothetical protein
VSECRQHRDLCDVPHPDDGIANRTSAFRHSALRILRVMAQLNPARPLFDPCRF